MWGNTYPSTIETHYILQKEAVRIITFEHSNPLFKALNVIKLFDLVSYTDIAIFMYKLHNKLLPSSFDDLFILTKKVHRCNTRRAATQSYHLPIKQEQTMVI